MITFLAKLLVYGSLLTFLAAGLMIFSFFPSIAIVGFIAFLIFLS